MINIKLRDRAVTKDDIVDAYNRELKPLVDQIRSFINKLVPSSGGGGTTTEISIVIKDKLTYYVAPDGRDDGNGTEDDPFASFEGIRLKWPNSATLCAPIIVYVAEGNYEKWTPFPAFIKGSDKAEIFIRGTGVEVLDTGTVDAGSNNYQINTTSTYSADQWTGATLSIGSELRDIQKTSTNALQSVETFSSAPANGDTYNIVKPSAVFDITGGAVFTNSNDIPTTLVNISFTDDGGGWGLMVQNMDLVRLFGVHFEMNAQIVSESNDFFYSGVCTDWYGYDNDRHFAGIWEAIGEDNSSNWLGWGVSSLDHSPINGYYPLFNKFEGYFTCAGSLFWLLTSGSIDAFFWGGYCRGMFGNGGSVRIGSKTAPEMRITSDDVGACFYFGQMKMSAIGGQYEVADNHYWAICDSIAEFRANANFTLNNPNAFGLLVRDTSRASIQGFPTWTLKQALFVDESARLRWAGSITLNGNSAYDAVVAKRLGDIALNDEIFITTCNNGINASYGGSVHLEKASGSSISGAADAQVRVSPTAGTTLALALPAVGGIYTSGAGRVTRGAT